MNDVLALAMRSEDKGPEESPPHELEDKLPVLKRRAGDAMGLAPIPVVEKTFELPKLVDPYLRNDDQDAEGSRRRLPTNRVGLSLFIMQF